MGSDASAKICLGVPLNEDEEYPWSEEGDIEDWWINIVCKYVPPFQLFDEKGEYLNGIKPTDEQINDYYEYLRKFKKEHPLPVDRIYYGSGDDSICILIVFGTDKRADWDEPVELDPDTIFSVKKENLDLFKKFCKDYLGIDDVQPKWLLSAYYG